jgi:hypothetical protein
MNGNGLMYRFELFMSSGARGNGVFAIWAWSILRKNVRLRPWSVLGEIGKFMIAFVSIWSTEGSMEYPPHPHWSDMNFGREIFTWTRKPHVISWKYASWCWNSKFQLNSLPFLQSFSILSQKLARQRPPEE